MRCYATRIYVFLLVFIDKYIKNYVSNNHEGLLNEIKKDDLNKQIIIK